MAEKTVVIWDMCGQEPIQFAVIDRDITHLDGIYINSSGNDPAKEDELSNLFYADDGVLEVDLTEVFPVHAVQAGAKVIVAGFLP
jgi:hypothetical protein